VTDLDVAPADVALGPPAGAAGGGGEGDEPRGRKGERVHVNGRFFAESAGRAADVSATLPLITRVRARARARLIEMPIRRGRRDRETALSLALCRFNRACATSNNLSRDESRDSSRVAGIFGAWKGRRQGRDSFSPIRDAIGVLGPSIGINFEIATLRVWALSSGDGRAVANRK